jgi:3-hydroxyacyl-CoA dehydrogenase
MPPPRKVFETISAPPRSRKSAAEAKEYLFLRPTDGITMNRDRLLADAKAKALALAEGYPAGTAESACPARRPRRLHLAVAGFPSPGQGHPHDVVVAAELADRALRRRHGHHRPSSETDLLELEREAFMRLVAPPARWRGSSTC